MKIQRISSVECYPFLLHKHYARRVPQITDAFGLFDGKHLVGVCTFGIPPSPPLCMGLCGPEYSSIVRELNRLCINDIFSKNNHNAASIFVSKCLKEMYGFIIVSFADTSMGHVGTIYKACNFLYTGLSDKRTEWREIGSNKHSKTIIEKYTLEERVANPLKFHTVDRPRKHRYIYFSGSKTMVKKWKRVLRYKQEPYPTGQSTRYDASRQIETQSILF